jgi:inward rectifier potassium channel
MNSKTNSSSNIGRKNSRDRIIHVAGRRLLAQGLERKFWADFYHHCLTVSWPLFFCGAAVIFLILNSGFAFLYWLGDSAIANVRPSSFADVFFFSIETLATVGYGDMHPQTTYGHLIATIEIFAGISCIAVMTGLVFTRFSQPRARLIFSNVAIVAEHNGKKTLMLRIANARHNMITDAVAKLWLVRLEKTKEGLQYRRFHELLIERGQNPMFALSWTIFHVIDKKSSLFGVDEKELERSDASLIITLTGLDETSNQKVHARHAYRYDDIRWGHQYVDILETSEHGLLRINYGKFHDTAPVVEQRER